MLKTLEKNSAGKVLKESWRQFAGWAIVLKDKRRDPLLRSEASAIFLQVIFAVVILLVSYIFFNYLHNSILTTLITDISEAIASGNFATGEDIMGSLRIVRAQNFILFSTILIILTLISAFTVAKVILRPVKNSFNAQKRFISDVAHELRTPLAVIKTNNEVALMEDHIDKKTSEMIRSNIEELDRISEIINNTLSFNNLLRPGRTKFSNIDIGETIDNSVSRLKELADQKDIEIAVKKVSPHIVWGSSVALEQIVSNLLKNAINYTNKGGHITVRVGPDYYGSVIINVEDNGIGISKQDLMHIFEPFYRAEKSRNKKYGSSGLGLTIVSELVKMHSGRISVRSAENEGTVVTVALPCGKKIDNEEKADASELNEVSINFSKEKAS